MKTSATWRLLIMTAGILLALLAGLGTAVPASAADRTTAGNGSTLSLSISPNGSYSVRGSGYSARTVHVWVVNIRTDRAVNQRSLRPLGGAFSFSDSGLGCNSTYKAVSFSKLDGWDETRAVQRHC